MDVQLLFRTWWQDSYGRAPGTHAEMTHIAFAQYVLQQAPPLPSSELVAEWSDSACGGGEATLAESDQRIAEMAIEWAWGQHAAS